MGGVGGGEKGNGKGAAGRGGQESVCPSLCPLSLYRPAGSHWAWNTPSRSVRENVWAPK